MLNKDLYLNENIFETPTLEATRDGYGKALLKLGEENPNIVVLTADLAESTRVDEFAKNFPDRFFDCGVAEQNMAAIAAGLGVSGKIAYISSYAVFSPGKNWETLRTTVVYNHSNVKIAGHHAGIMTGPDGPTHQATEDIAITRCWPKMKVIVPADSIEAYKATYNSSESEDPYYIRFTRDKTPVITTSKTPYDENKIQVFWVSNNPQVTIAATGYMLYYALIAASNLQKEGVETEVLNISSIKPLDQDTILKSVSKTNALITIEDHQVDGGMGSAISEMLSRRRPTLQEFVGLQNTFAESGDTKALIEKYGLSSKSIQEKTINLLKRKNG